MNATPNDVRCECGHWLNEHGPGATACGACSCPRFVHDIEGTAVGLAEPRDGLVVIQRLTAPELRAQRAEAMRKLRKAEWDFDRHPTLTNATICATLRSSISAAEMQLASSLENGES